jgi:hypothetical protein
MPACFFLAMSKKIRPINFLLFLTKIQVFIKHKKT